MQKLYILLALLIFTSFSLQAQLQSANSSEEQIERFKETVLNPQPQSIVVVAEDIHVLDSTISYFYDEPINGINSKRMYQYDEDARQTDYNFYRFDYNNLMLFNSTNTITNYVEDTIFTESEYASDALTDLISGNRSWSIRNDQGWSLEYYSDYYDIDTESWKKSFKQVALEWEEDYQLYENSNWVDTISTYITSSRAETTTTVDTTESVTSLYDESTETFNPAYGYTSIYAPDGSHNAFVNRSYENGEWVNTYEYEYIADFENLTAVGKSYGSDWATGLWIPYDSTASVLDEDLKTIERNIFSWDNTDNTYSIFRNKSIFTYDENGLNDQIFAYNEAGVLTNQTDYFYSTITVVDTDEPFSDFALNLQFPNPATKSDQVQVVSNGDDLGKQFDAQIFNQQGQLMAQQRVQVGDNIELNKLVANGLYFIVLNDGVDRRAWKVMIAN